MTTDTQMPPVSGETAQKPPRSQMNLTEKKVVSKLRDNVDERGNFKFKLNDFALGYAAGKNVTEVAAKEHIKEMFEKEIGTDIQTYLENDRIAKGLEVDRDS